MKHPRRDVQVWCGAQFRSAVESVSAEKRSTLEKGPRRGGQGHLSTNRIQPSFEIDKRT